MRYFLVLLACGAVGLGASPALAFKNIEGCDMVAFASPSSPVPIAPERWQAYRQAATTILGAAPQSVTTIGEWRPVAAQLIAAQKSLLEPEKGSPAYRDYLAGDTCRLLVKLNPGAVQARLDEAAQSTPEPAMAALRHVTDAARNQMDSVDRSARFRSGLDRTLSLAGYNCFVAGAIVGLLPPERQQAIALEDFGEIAACKDAGRTG